MPRRPSPPAPAAEDPPARFYAVFPDPLGWALAVAEPAGNGAAGANLVLLSHCASEAEAHRLRQGLHPHAVDAPDDASAAPLRILRRQLDEYFAGRRRRFDLPLAPAGTDFQLRVWEALRRIPFGETRTYGELASAVGNAGASRAVGQANSRNPIGVVIPCHRVVAAGGRLGGYSGGLERKRKLLALEGHPAFEA